MMNFVIYSHTSRSVYYLFCTVVNHLLWEKTQLQVKTAVPWVVVLCRLVSVCPCFGVTCCCPHFQGWKKLFQYDGNYCSCGNSDFTDGQKSVIS